MLGVRIGVIVGGQRVRVDEYGLMQPTMSYGPNTKEQILLYNAPDVTFKCLLPRVREPKPEDSTALADALAVVHRMKDLDLPD